MIWYGGDYNPEQWPEEVWAEDARRMQRGGRHDGEPRHLRVGDARAARGGVRLRLAGSRDGRAARGRRAADLATATASPPPWPTLATPRCCPSGRTACDVCRQPPAVLPEFARIPPTRGSTRVKIAERYAQHPALAMWHVNNEYGCHVNPATADARRRVPGWLEDRYATVEALNEAWGTTFWSQRYSGFAEVQPPRAMPSFGNPGQLLDFDRFSADQLLELYRAEAAIVRAATPSTPVTTNFMGFFKGADYWAWAQEVDVVSDDSYPDPADPVSPAYAAMSRDLMRSLRHGQPWILMEQAPSAVNWRARNAPKAPGQMAAWSNKRSRAALTASCSSNGDSRWPAQRSSTRACCRTQAPTRGCGARSPNSVPTSPAWRRSRAAASRRGSRSCSSGIAGEVSSKRRCPRG